MFPFLDHFGPDGLGLPQWRPIQLSIKTYWMCYGHEYCGLLLNDLTTTTAFSPVEPFSLWRRFNPISKATGQFVTESPPDIPAYCTLTLKSHLDRKMGPSPKWDNIAPNMVQRGPKKASKWGQTDPKMIPKRCQSDPSK